RSAAVRRRSRERTGTRREIRSPGATLDSANRLITFKDGRETSLTAREFEFLTYMATHPNRVITRDELLRRVWDVDPRLTDTRSVEMTVMRLRDKLGPASASPLETLRSQGYRWNSSFVS
uniref:winged helix-turn-helix domain-containing protein n=1 Tax=Akkermansia muciniphila TaxID=239935 RepID=UPI003FD7B753